MQLGTRLWMWISENFHSHVLWFYENFHPRTVLIPSTYFTVLERFAFPIFINLMFFCLVFFVLRKRNPLGYLTLRNVAINAAITIGGVYVNNLRGTFIQFLHFGGNPMQHPYIFEPRTISIGVSISIALFWMMLSILVLAQIYHFTIGGLPLRTLLLNKTAIGAFAITIALMTAQYVYLLYFLIWICSYMRACLSFLRCWR